MAEIANDLDIRSEHLIPYGRDKAKVHLDALAKPPRQGRLILVSAITPTSAGEGKTTTAIGLGQGLATLGEKVAIALREPSLGPTFGLKGGATGNSRASLVPAVDINLHFTGDFHAISSANNLLAATLDNHLHHGNRLGIDPRRVTWRRVIDLNDRSLRQTMVGLGGPMQGVPRETGFDITPASEIMAVLCLADDLDDLRSRLARMLVAVTHEQEPITTEDLKAVGSLMVLLKDAVHPNLVQTCEGVPVFLHGGPFANIAHGCNSLFATRMALAHADWVVTEAGFGFDLGGEKFLDIKCRDRDLDPAAIVLVATVKALKRHGGVPQKALGGNDPEAVERGIPNLEKHVENARAFGKEPVVALNRFASDSDEELAVVRQAAERMGVTCAMSEGVMRGGEGAAELAQAVMDMAARNSEPYKPLYSLDASLEEKMETIATRMYGAGSVAFAPAARKQKKVLKRLGLDHLPLCVAKAPTSLSAKPTLVGRPEGFEVTVRDLVPVAGAGFIVPLLGDILRMPGLGASPQLERVDLVDGEVQGLR